MKDRVFEALAGDDVEEDEGGKLQWHGRVRADPPTKYLLFLHLLIVVDCVVLDVSYRRPVR
jgi:hypothetical protein